MIWNYEELLKIRQMEKVQREGQPIVAYCIAGPAKFEFENSTECATLLNVSIDAVTYSLLRKQPVKDLLLFYSCNTNYRQRDMLIKQYKNRYRAVQNLVNNGKDTEKTNQGLAQA